jgi:hypothetical protein
MTNSTIKRRIRINNKRRREKLSPKTRDLIKR